ncbi:HAD family hydrolase [Streptomyces antibioticus]|uniref:HAD family hydrolase n=1 Tax=Streptomyces antibioticus TaxID=1890 RepID=A0AAE7CM81_STRAT|nr:HAD family hydrolase [Streptomyces antibioticus]QIT46099.1 HAD family hydrolase [Streptomyces antibioticus]
MLALFDLDNTLLNRNEGLASWARGFVQSRRLPAGAESVICERLRERAYREDFMYLRRVLRLNETPDELWGDYVQGIAQSVRCYQGVRQYLKALRDAGWTLGIATNGAGDIQRAKLNETGLAPFFQGIAISEEIGVRKPARNHFEAAAELCGASIHTGGWMVGDGPDTDMGGGRGAGLRTAWVSNGRRWIFGPREPDVVARDVAEAIEALLAAG